MNGFRLPGFLAFGIVAGLCGTNAAFAQPVINGTFYEEVKSAGCVGASCIIEFTALSSRVLFNKVNCYAHDLPGDMRSIAFGVRDTPNTVSRRNEFLPFSPPALSTGGSRYYTLSVQSDFLFALGKIPAIVASVNSGAGAQVECKITGRIQP